MGSKTWSDSEKTELERLHISGMKPTEIGRQLGRTRMAVKAKIVWMGLDGQASHDCAETTVIVGNDGGFRRGQREAENAAFVKHMESLGFRRFQPAGPPDIVFREPIWRGAT